MLNADLALAEDPRVVVVEVGGSAEAASPRYRVERTDGSAQQLLREQLGVVVYPQVLVIIAGQVVSVTAPARFEDVRRLLALLDRSASGLTPVPRTSREVAQEG